MALNPLATANTTKQRLDQADLNTLADQARAVGLGTVIRRMRVALRRANPFAQVANPYAPAGMNVITLPDDAKASALFVGDFATSNAAAWVRSQDASQSTGATGAYTNKTPWGTTPTTGTVGILPTGDIAFLATDAPNDVDLCYEVAIQDVVELTLNVVPGTGVCAIPAKYAPAGPGKAGLGGTLTLMEAESLSGTLVRKMIVLVPAAGAPATTQARLDVAKANVQFAVADAVTSCRVKLGIVPALDVNAVLEATSGNL
jgi:hypothetical protein